jgi:tetratricopeptide (TPR) repeat protein
MTPIRHVTVVLVLAAFAAAGCSKRDDTVHAKEGSPDSVVKPATTRVTAGREPLNRVGEEARASDSIPTISNAMSFGDGETAYRAKDYGQAAAIFEHYTGQRPNNPWGHYMLGLSAWKSGDLAKSEQAFEKALSVDPQHLKSLVNLSRVFIDQKRHEDAIERLTRAADIDPESVQVFRLLGRTYHNQGKRDEAVEAYRRAIELNELDAWSMNNLGLIFLETNRAEEAVPLLARAAELKPEVPAFHNNLGMALEHTGRFSEAATAYKGALAADPRYDKAQRNLTRIEAIQGAV